MYNFFQKKYYGTKDYVKYAAGKHWIQIFLAFVIMIIVFFCIKNTQLPTNSPKPEGLDWWTKLLDPLLGLGTFLIALAVWFLEVNRERKSNMANKLTVFFDYKGVKMMTCEKAYLASESDIRAWGQQIGSQMSGVPRLDLKPYIEQEPAVMEFDDAGKPFLHYQVTFFLNKLPKSNPNEDKNEDLGKYKPIVWRPQKATLYDKAETWTEKNKHIA